MGLELDQFPVEPSDENVAIEHVDCTHLRHWAKGPDVPCPKSCITEMVKLKTKKCVCCFKSLCSWKFVIMQ